MQTLILYAHRDQNFAERIYADLYALGVRPWMRNIDVAPGDDMDEVEFEQLQNAGAVIALFSNHFDSDPQLIEYAEAAHALGAVLIPVIIDQGVKVPEHLPKAVKMTRRYAAGVEAIAALIPEKAEPLPKIPAWQRGNMAYHAEDYEKAVAAYEEIEAPTPEERYSRAAAYNALREHEKALADLDAAIAEDSANDRFFRNRSLAYAGLGKHEAALEDDLKALAINPESPLNQSSYAMTLVSLKRFDEAKTALEKTISLVPEDTLYRYQLGYLNMQAEDWEAALAAFDEVLADDPENDGAIVGRRMVLGHLGRHPEALADIDKALKREPRKSAHHLTRSLINFYLGDFDQAAKDATLALRYAKGEAFAPAYFNRAIAYWRAGETEAAQADFRTVMEIIPDLNSENGIRSRAESEQTAQAALEILASLED